MNWININGRDSRQVIGRRLVIQELPPVVKPPMRIQQDVVDGVFGENITELGFSSYEKTMRIGVGSPVTPLDLENLTRFFAQPFNPSNDLIFSNDPDYIYKGRVYKQITFNRAGRFRESDVTFLCQPFKYPASLPPLRFTSNSMMIPSWGTTYALPSIALTGSGIINVYYGGELKLTIDFGESTQSLVIDCEAQNAYDGDILANRQVVGNYADFKVFDEQTMTLEGSWNSCVVSNYERYI